MGPSFGMGSFLRHTVSIAPTHLPKQKLAQKYFEQIEKESHIPFSSFQKDNLYKYLDQFTGTPLEPEKVKELRQQYNVWKIKLIVDWVCHYQQPWPHELKWVQGIYRPVMWDVHHIFHLSCGGPNVFWNIHPLTRDVHHHVIHRVGSPGEVLHGRGKLKEFDYSQSSINSADYMDAVNWNSNDYASYTSVDE